MSQEEIYQVFKEREGELLTSKDVQELLAERGINISILAVRNSLARMKDVLHQEKGFSEQRRGQQGHWYRLKE